MSVDPQYPISKATDTPSDDPEAEVAGHALKKPLMDLSADDPEAEVEGHIVRSRAVEQPADADDDAPGDTESLYKKY